jgi:hypothetical protein
MASVEYKQNQANPATGVIPPATILVAEKQWTDRMILHFTHEKRLAAYKKDFHQIYIETFAETPASDVKVIVGNQNSANL